MSATVYDRYRFSKKEIIYIVILWGAISFLTGYLFYENTITGILIFLFLPVVACVVKKKRIKQRKLELRNQFKEALLALSAALISGYSIENAIKESYKEMVTLFGEEADICNELKYMCYQLQLNKTVESLFLELAKRSGVEDIAFFYEILCVAKRMGGNIVEVITKATNNICEKIEVKKDIEVMVQGKIFEQNIMSTVVPLMIMYLKFSSPGFLDIMYETILGKIIMTVCLLLYIVAIVLSKVIIRIDV